MNQSALIFATAFALAIALEPAGADSKVPLPRRCQIIADIREDGAAFLGETCFDQKQITAIIESLESANEGVRVLFRAKRTVKPGAIKPWVKALETSRITGSKRSFVFSSYKPLDLPTSQGSPQIGGC